jgi:hypothetical protein
MERRRFTREFKLEAGAVGDLSLLPAFPCPRPTLGRGITTVGVEAVPAFGKGRCEPAILNRGYP